MATLLMIAFRSGGLVKSLIASKSTWRLTMIDRKKEIAKFFCGFETFHTLFHAYLWLSGTTFAAFGITTTPAWNAAGTILNSAIAVILGVYGWKQRKLA
ncbi:hypothetical protein DM611_11400 [Stenotrophomonas maltophilia]|nr:hypothetical protein DM611_11400 [Stenotrophomonas maltophilia]